MQCDFVTNEFRFISFFYQLDTEYVGVICYFKLQEALDRSLGPGLKCGRRKAICSSLT